VKEVAPYHLYFNRTLFSHGSFTETAAQRAAGYVGQHSTDYVRPENQRAAALLREDFRGLTHEAFEKQAANLPYGTAEEVASASSPRPSMPAPTWCRSASTAGDATHPVHEPDRALREAVLPILQAHEVTRVPRRPRRWWRSVLPGAGLPARS
jgi:hypothetical protein